MRRHFPLNSVPNGHFLGSLSASVNKKNVDINERVIVRYTTNLIKLFSIFPANVSLMTEGQISQLCGTKTSSLYFLKL